MIYAEYKPAKALQPYIECYWSAVANRPPFQDTEALIPDGKIELMFNFGDNYQQIIGNQKQTVKGSHIIGIREQSLFIAQSKRQDFFTVRFKTGGTFPFFQIPAHYFSNQFLHISDLLGKSYQELEEKLYYASNLQRVQILNHFFLFQLNSLPKSLQTTLHFLQYAQFKKQPNIDQIRSEMNIHYKKLERHFKETTGITPRKYLKIQRFNQSVRLLYSGRFDSLTKVAYEMGYFDQSHFIRDFKSLTFQSPREFLRERFKIVEVVQEAMERG